MIRLDFIEILTAQFILFKILKNRHFEISSIQCTYIRNKIFNVFKAKINTKY
jgi:hypothetical protein